MAAATEQKYLESQNIEGQPLPQQLPPGGQLQSVCGGVPVVVAPVSDKDRKSVADAYLLAIPLGWLGAHHFYLRRYGFGVLYFFTFGLLGAGWVIDWFRVPSLVKDANRRLQNPGDPPRKLLSDAYVTWFPLGLFGFHHFYLRRWGWGFAYLFTVGLFGIGWIVDAFRMPSLVRNANRNLEAEARGCPLGPVTVSLAVAYVLALCPLTGLLGCSHFYLRRWFFGIVYLLTFGLCGVGYLVDWFRMPCLVKHVNRKFVEGDDGKKRMDDAYLLLLPLGFLGLHHFYLRRYGWGFLYLFTFGILGFGWLVDFVRLAFLVREYNREADNQRRRLLEAASVIIAAGAPGGYINPAGPPGYGSVDGSHVDGTVLPNPTHPGPHYPPPGPAEPPVYGAAGYSSWSTIDSSDVGGPPSYQEAIDDSTSKGDRVQACPPSAGPEIPTAPPKAVQACPPSAGPEIPTAPPKANIT